MNYFFAVSCLLASFASINAGDYGHDDGLVYAPAYSLSTHSIPKYSFEYSVKDPSTGDNKAQWEKREGDGVKGSYSLVEPGGGVRTVDYWADGKSGFNAIVRRDGPKVHPPTIRIAPIAKVPMYTSAVAPLPIAHVAPIAHYAAAPAYGALSTLSVSKVSVPAPALSLPIPVAPIVTAPAIVPYAKAYMPAPMMPLPYLPNYLHSLGSYGGMSKLY